MLLAFAHQELLLEAGLRRDSFRSRQIRIAVRVQGLNIAPAEMDVKRRIAPDCYELPPSVTK